MVVREFHPGDNSLMEQGRMNTDGKSKRLAEYVPMTQLLRDMKIPPRPEGDKRVTTKVREHGNYFYCLVASTFSKQT